MTENQRKVVVIGIDGATFDLIRPWIDSGELPALKELIEQGSYCDLETTIPPVTGPAWVSFKTGQNPGKHGIYEFWQRKPDSYQFSVLNSTAVSSPAIWDVMAKHKKDAVVINVPMTYPAKKIKGYMVAGMLSPSVNSKNFTYPENLKETLLKEIPEYNVLLQHTFNNENEAESYLKVLYSEIDYRKKAIQYFSKNKNWDFLIGFFEATDVVMHRLWNYMDEKHPRHMKNPILKEGILNVYKYLDKAIKEITNDLPEDVSLIIMSDHGFGPLEKVFNTNTFLLEKGLIKLKKNPISFFKYIQFLCGITPENVYKFLSKLGLQNIKGKVRFNRLGRIMLKTLFLSFDDVDWKKTKAYAHGFIGEIFINLKGREPEGCVEKEDYESLRTAIKKELMQITDSNRIQAVKKIFYKEEIYTGEHLDAAPDIVFFPKDLEWLCAGDFEFISNKIISDPPISSTGHHRMNGILIAKGPDIKNGEIKNPVSIIDLAPTILYYMGLPIPKSMDGKVISDIFDPEFIKKNEIEYESTEKLHKKPMQLSGEDETTINKRLHDLGYLG